MNRFEKLEYLLETCSSEFIDSCIMLREMVGWMSEDNFNAFYDRLCCNWNIEPDPKKLQQRLFDGN